MSVRVFASRFFRLMQHGIYSMIGRAARVPRIYVPKSPAKARAAAESFRMQFWRQFQRVYQRQSVLSRMSTVAVLSKGRRAVFNSRSSALAAVLLASRDAQYGADWLDRVKKMMSDQCRMYTSTEHFPRSLDGYDIDLPIAKGCNSVVYRARIHGSFSPRPGEDLSPVSSMRAFPLAIKMMFNYDVAPVDEYIYQEMSQELIPAVDKQITRMVRRHHTVSEAHPHIIKVEAAFVDAVRLLPNIGQLAPSALPPELHPQGLGQSHTMFVVMKRYSKTLREYMLTANYDCRMRQLLLAQLLEAVRFLQEQKIAHRDLKSNNVLVEFDDESITAGTPNLVVTDFGCSLAAGSFSLNFAHSHVDLGGNVALRAPEIAIASPGVTNYVDFSRSDLWAAGTIGYELFTNINPFYGQLKNTTYQLSDLPPLPDCVPYPLRKLLVDMLQPRASKRPSPECAANTSVLSLFGLDSLCLVAAQLGHVFPERILSRTAWLNLSDAVALYVAETLLARAVGKMSQVEYRLRSMFLNRVDMTALLETMVYFGHMEEPEPLYSEVL